MESAAMIIPTSISFLFRRSTPPPQPLFSPTFFSFGIHQSKKLRNSSLFFSSCFHSNQRNPRRDPGGFGFSSNPFSILKNFAHQQTQRWGSFLPSRIVSETAPTQNGGSYLQNGGFGVALLSVTANAKLRISPFVATLAANPTFVSGFLGLFFAQLIKVLLNFFVERKWDLRIMFASGGMPSSHSSLCSALTTSVALCHGVADSLFPACLGFSLIVMYDAIGVRRHAGMQAEVLNMIVADLFQGHPISQRKLKELLGHTPSQVLAGALLGILVAFVCCRSSLIRA